MTMQRSAIWLLGGILLAGCSEQKPTVDVPVTKAPALESAAKTKPGKGSTTQSGDYDATVGGFKFKVPGDWEEQPPKSEFVLGEFSIPGPDGNARLTLSSAGGGVEANVQRWRDQFAPGPNDPDPRESEVTFDGHKGTLVELAGSYSDMLSRGGPNRNWRMLGVAVNIGPTNYFVKMTGPATTVNPRREEFLKFVESARMEK